jgi:hypothetical protein
LTVPLEVLVSLFIEGERAARAPDGSGSVTFLVHGLRAEAIAAELSDVLRELYRAAWMEEVGEALATIGWFHTQPQSGSQDMVLMGRRACRPAADEIEEVLQQALFADDNVERHLDTAIKGRPELIRAVGGVRARHGSVVALRMIARVTDENGVARDEVSNHVLSSASSAIV